MTERKKPLESQGSSGFVAVVQQIYMEMMPQAKPNNSICSAANV